jgi:hypothetical protein
MDMQAAAEWYCFLVERAESSQRAEFVAEVAQALAELVAAAGRLPRMSLVTPDQELKRASGCATPATCSAGNT